MTMGPVWRELMVFPIVLGPATPFYVWQFRAAIRGRRADLTASKDEPR